MEEKREDNKKKNIILLILLLILLIIIIFLLLKCFGRIEHKTLVPTGNVDIFDINFGNCGCGNENSCENSQPVGGEVTPNLDVTVYDDDLEYSTTTKLNIFTQTSYYVVDKKIAPTSENSYQFIIRNNNNLNITYSLEMFETNKYNINMKFRLKLNGVYVVGSNKEYVSAEELKQYNKMLNGNKYDVYTLDWKWFESSNDTEVGMNIDSNYELNVKITASSN